MNPDKGRGAQAELCVCTIVSKNYLSQARALADSLRAHNPDVRFYVLLADRVDGCFDPQAEPFTLIELEQLPIPDLPRFCFQYTVVELNTAAKPYFLEHLFEKHGVKKLVYLDPDILVFDSLQPLADLLDAHTIVLTPHITRPLEDQKTPNEVDILRAGTYNLGFLALAHKPEALELLKWWKERLYTQCVADPEQGLFVDQKWIDLVPGYFEGASILRDPSYNVAYWNLAGRAISMCGGKPFVDGKPCRFFHFSGFNPLDPERVSKHQNRFVFAELGQTRQVFEIYEERLLAHGYEKCREWPYAFGAFDNGIRIADFIRRTYWKMGDKAKVFGNPFVTDGAKSFFSWLISFKGRDLPPLLKEILKRPGVGDRFPEVHWGTYHHFMSWLSGKEGLMRAKIDPRFLEHVCASSDSQAIVLGSTMACLGQAVPSRPFGVNLSGYLQSEKGMGEAARAVVRALEAASIPYVLNNVVDSLSHNMDQSLRRFSADNPYLVNIVQVNADQVQEFVRSRPAYMGGHYNIGYWNWELASFPDELRGSCRCFDEIWVPSGFTLESVSAVSPVPVRMVPFAMTVPQTLPEGVERGRFGLPEDAFVFLFAFDFQSYLARKNPLAVIEAFQRAFGDRPDVILVLKMVHAASAPSAFAKVRSACRGQANIHLIQEVLSRDEMHALLMLSDAYVSLHRSEGFGLPLCEAMAMGKPVIATGYSANVDFMNPENSMLVRHRLVEIDEDHGPYRAGWIWAEPDVVHAAELMRRLVDEPGLAAYLGNRARRDIAREMSPARIGEMIASRLHALIEQRATFHGYENSVLRKAEFRWLEDFQDLNHVSCKSHRWVLGPILTLLRKATSFLLRPVFNCQNKYNEKMSETIATLVQRLGQQQHELVALTRVLHQQRFRAHDDESADTEEAPRVAA